MKKRYIILFSLVFGLGGVYITLVSIGRNIPVDDTPLQLLQNTQKENKVEIQIFALETGSAFTLEGLIFAGGSIFKTKKLVHNAVLIQHPKGNVLIDTGIGKKIDHEFQAVQWWAKPLLAYTKKESARDILDRKQIKIKKIILTHLHWDHAGGIKEFPEAEIYASSDEYTRAYSRQAKPPGYLQSQYTGGIIRWNLIQFDSRPYEIFSESFDVYSDGTIVLVKLEGHSPGSIGVFVNCSLKERYFFVGDLTWSLEALKHPAQKFFISSAIVDFNTDMLAKQIVRIHKFMKMRPDLHIIPSHDSEAYKGIAELKSK